jgi:hypothetical protein
VRTTIFITLTGDFKMETAKKKDVTESGPADKAHAPRHLTLAENAVLTVKVLAVAGVILAVLWGIDAWTTG